MKNGLEDEPNEVTGRVRPCASPIENYENAASLYQKRILFTTKTNQTVVICVAYHISTEFGQLNP